MEFLELAKKRYSCRNFEEKEVEEEKILKILEAARLAPTAVNLQPQKIIVLDKKEDIIALKEATPYTFDAPVVMVIGYDKNLSWKRKSDQKDEGIVDASIVTTHMMLEITDLGLGCTWVGYFDEAKVREILGLEDHFEVVALLPLGYKKEGSKEGPMHGKRKDLEEIVIWRNRK